MVLPLAAKSEKQLYFILYILYIILYPQIVTKIFNLDVCCIAFELGTWLSSSKFGKIRGHQILVRPSFTYTHSHFGHKDCSLSIQTLLLEYIVYGIMWVFMKTSATCYNTFSAH